MRGKLRKGKKTTVYFFTFKAHNLDGLLTSPDLSGPPNFHALVLHHGPIYLSATALNCITAALLTKNSCSFLFCSNAGCAFISLYLSAWHWKHHFISHQKGENLVALTQTMGNRMSSPCTDGRRGGLVALLPSCARPLSSLLPCSLKLRQLGRRLRS